MPCQPDMTMPGLNLEIFVNTVFPSPHPLKMYNSCFNKILFNLKLMATHKEVKLNITQIEIQTKGRTVIILLLKIEASYLNR